MMKASCLLLGLAVSSGAVCAEQTDSCAGLDGPVLEQCRGNQQIIRLQQQLEQQIQQQQQRQDQLDRQQREVQQQLESMRLQNESLRKQLEREAANQPSRTAATYTSRDTDSSKGADIKSWRADNPWFGTDYAKTQFAMRYIKQLQQERPDLGGRELLDALSSKVNDTFVTKH